MQKATTRKATVAFLMALVMIGFFLMRLSRPFALVSCQWQVGCTRGRVRKLHRASDTCHNAQEAAAMAVHRAAPDERSA